MALTPHIMNVMERFVPITRPSAVVYQPPVGVDVPIVHLLHKTHSFLDRPNTPVHIMFFRDAKGANRLNKKAESGVGGKLVVLKPL